MEVSTALAPSLQPSVLLSLGQLLVAHLGCLVRWVGIPDRGEMARPRFALAGVNPFLPPNVVLSIAGIAGIGGVDPDMPRGAALGSPGLLQIGMDQLELDLANRCVDALTGTRNTTGHLRSE